MFKALFVIMVFSFQVTFANLLDETKSMVEKYNNYFSKDITIELTEDDCMPSSYGGRLTFCEDIITFMEENNLHNIWRLVVSHEYAHELFDYSISNEGKAHDDQQLILFGEKLLDHIDETKVRDYFFKMYDENYYYDIPIVELISIDLVGNMTHNYIDVLAKKLLTHFNYPVEVSLQDYLTLNLYFKDNLSEADIKNNEYRASVFENEYNISCLLPSLSIDSSYVKLKSFVLNEFGQDEYGKLFKTCTLEQAETLFFKFYNQVVY